MNIRPCPLCLDASTATVRADEADVSEIGVEVDCRRCGRLRITAGAQIELAKLSQGHEKRRHLMVAVRQAAQAGRDLVLTSENLDEIASSARIAHSLTEALDRLLLAVHDFSAAPHDAVAFDVHTDYPLLGLTSPESLAFVLDKGVRSGYLESSEDHTEVRLDLKGWDRVAVLLANRTKSAQAFVAMWFSSETGSLWTDGIEPALIATGYRPLRIDILEHNERIDDQILAEIRRSGLVVADFTGQRAGVYFEAGFAMGLGIPVIRTCRQDWLDSLHFDTRQYNHIIWESAEELRGLLVRRIEATAGIGSI